MKTTVGIQGILGSYHHEVAVRYFENETLDIHECMSFDALAELLFSGTIKYAVMAIENSIAGSIIPNYALIDQNDFQICGEYYLKINHCLIAMANQNISDIKKVCSHPMALLQCKSFLKNHPEIKRIETSDTAYEVKKIAQNKTMGIAAIASQNSAKLYGLNVLNQGIQTIKDNATRFVILKKQTTEDKKKDINKVSLKFELDHKKGSLATVLNVLSDCNLNLTKIQSLPIIETPWKYAFFVDITFEDYSDFSKAFEILKIMTYHLKLFGKYKHAKR